MNHFSTTLLGAALLAMVAASAQAKTTIGYTTGQITRNKGIFNVGSSLKQGVAIRIGHDKLQALKGQTIESIEVDFATRVTVNNSATLFIATTLDGDPLLTQDVVIPEKGGTQKFLSYALSQPYTITGLEQDLYIGYRSELAESGRSIHQSDLSADLRGCSYAWEDDHWTDLYGMGYGSANIRAVLQGDVAFSDVIVGELDLNSNYYKAANGYKHSTMLYNFGTTPITDLEVTVQVGDKQQTLTYTGLNIAQAGTYTITLPEVISEESGQTFDIHVNARIPGIDDADPADNAFQTSAFFYPADMERSILMEEFTGIDCVNCPSGKTRLESAIQQSQLPCIEIMHHAGYSPDILSTEADWNYTMYYGSAQTGAPAVMVDRIQKPSNPMCPVMMAPGVNDILESLQIAANRQPYASMGMASTYDATTRTVSIRLGVLAQRDIPGQAIVNVYLIQDSIIGHQAGGGENYVHNGSLRQVLTGNTWGLLLPTLQPGQIQDWNYSFVLPETIRSDFWTEELMKQSGKTEAEINIATDLEHMRIVAYVANYNPNNINDNRIYNCIEVPLVNGVYVQGGMQWDPLAITAVQTDGDTPASRPGIYDLTGHRLQSGSRLPAGLYIINGKKTYVCQ